MFQRNQHISDDETNKLSPLVAKRRGKKSGNVALTCGSTFIPGIGGKESQGGRQIMFGRDKDSMCSVMETKLL